MANKNASNTNITVSSAGAINYPVQPAFFAFLSSNVANVTGNNTNYTILCDSVVYNQSSSYVAGTGIFTAPVTGRYHFTVGVTIANITATNTARIIVVTSNRQVYIRYFDANATKVSASNDQLVSGSCYVDMDASDTAFVRINVNDIGADTIGVNGQATDPITWFSGMLVS